MKDILLSVFIAVSVLSVSCNKTTEVLPPVVNSDPYLNPYAGSYNGLFVQEVNGVDSNGVFKDSSGNSGYHMDIIDAGNYEITITKGPFVFDHIPVDSTGYFATDSPYIASDSLQYDFHGQFRNDSVYIYYHALNGSWNYPQWFTIVHMSFIGTKVL
ncbi:MAG: hypothetical protein ACHQD9_05785 [Chitinophagales bacterium]